MKNTPLWLTKLISELKQAGKLSADYVGEIEIKVNLSQGGIQDAKLTIPERIR